MACCWLWQAFVLLHWLFQLTIDSSVCLGSLQRAESCSRVLNSTGRFSQSLICLSSVRPHTVTKHTLIGWSCLPYMEQCCLLTYRYLCPSLPVEHRPSMTPRHRTVFCAALVILGQLVPCCFSSASVSRLQLLWGRPLFLFPCRFQVRAWCVVLDAGFLRVCPIQPHSLRSICLALVPVTLAPTDLHFRSSLAIGLYRCTSDRCWRMSWSFVASSVLSAMSHIRRVGLTLHWSGRCGVWFSCWFLQMPRCFWAWRKLLLPCRFWLWRLGLCLPVGQPRFPGIRKTPPPWGALHQLWLVHWQLCSSSSAQSSSWWSWALSLLMWSPGEWSCRASGCDCVTGAPDHQRSWGRLAASRVSTVYHCSYLL